MCVLKSQKVLPFGEKFGPMNTAYKTAFTRVHTASDLEQVVKIFAKSLAGTVFVGDRNPVPVGKRPCVCFCCGGAWT